MSHKIFMFGTGNLAQLDLFLKMINDWLHLTNVSRSNADHWNWLMEEHYKLVWESFWWLLTSKRNRKPQSSRRKLWMGRETLDLLSSRHKSKGARIPCCAWRMRLVGCIPVMWHWRYCHLPLGPHVPRMTWLLEGCLSLIRLLGSSDGVSDIWLVLSETKGHSQNPWMIIGCETCYSSLLSFNLGLGAVGTYGRANCIILRRDKSKPKWISISPGLKALLAIIMAYLFFVFKCHIGNYRTKINNVCVWIFLAPLFYKEVQMQWWIRKPYDPYQNRNFWHNMWELEIGNLPSS